MMICLLIGSLGFREALTNLIAKFRRFTPYLQAIFRGVNPTFCMCVYGLIWNLCEKKPIRNPPVSCTSQSDFTNKQGQSLLSLRK